MLILKGIGLVTILRNLYGKKQLIVLTSFYISQESDIKIFLKLFVGIKAQDRILGLVRGH